MVEGLPGHSESSTTVPAGIAMVSVPLTDSAGTKNVEQRMTTLFAESDHLNKALGPVPLSLSCGIDRSPISMWSRTRVSSAGGVHERSADGRSLMPVKQDSHRLSCSTPPRM